MILNALAAAVLGTLAAASAAAQESPAPGAAPAAPAAPVSRSSQSSAQAEAGEPRADTSASATQAETPSAAAAPVATKSAAPVRAQRVAAASPKASAAGPKPGANDSLDLGTATVTGDREQPKVMYIVPWKKSDIGDLSGKPMNSLLDEALAPVDRDEFKREVVYYQAVKSDASQNSASKPPSGQGEK
jgi:hypothetical protein